MKNDVHPGPSPFGLEMKRRRLELGLSIVEASRRCSLGQVRWGQLERGVRAGSPDQQVPGEDTVIKVAVGLEMDPRESLKLAGFDPAIYSPTTLEPRYSPAKFLDLVDSLSYSNQALLYAMALRLDNPNALVDVGAITAALTAADGNASTNASSGTRKTRKAEPAPKPTAPAAGTSRKTRVRR